MSDLERLRAALTATGPPDAVPDALELSEILWLACHLTPAEEAGPAAGSPRPAPADRAETPLPFEAPAAPGPPREAVPEPASPLTAPRPPRPVPDAPAGPPGGPPGETATEVLVPTAPMLADPLGVQRALRPLKRRVPSRHRRELDEEATAARIADARLWTPVLVPAPERWLTLALVVDDGPAMRLWRPLARELAEALVRQGAFRHVHVSHLDVTGRVAAAPGAPAAHPGTLLDASGRHAVLVLSDCSGPHWWDGRAASAVRRWARAGPTAILQPLAERLWRRTAAPAVPGLAMLPRPGAPNTDLGFAPHDGVRAAGIGVPVLEVAPRWLGAWARLVAGAGPQPAAVATLPARPPGAAPVRRERELPVAERVRRFLATASPAAAELAAHVAVSVPSLPVMRLIQHRVLGGSGPGQLAEVLLSGLLRPAGGVRYAFVPGARDALLDTLARPEAQHTRRVLEAVSAEIERRAGTAAETFRALLPETGGALTLVAESDHFALVTRATRAHLTPAPPDEWTPPPSTVPWSLAPGAPPAPAEPAMPEPPLLLDLLRRPASGPDGDPDRPPAATIVGVNRHGGTVRVDVLGGGRTPHGTIVGPRAARHALLRTLVLGLASGHSTRRLSLAFADFSDGAAFEGLTGLPHVVAAVHGTSAADEPVAGLARTLEDERSRRAAMLAAAGLRTWAAYQAAADAGRPLPPLPALVVVVDGAVQPLNGDLGPFGHYLDGLAADLGIRFVCSAQVVVNVPGRWEITLPDAAPGAPAALVTEGRDAPVRFVPAYVPAEAVGRLVAEMADLEALADAITDSVEPDVPAREDPPLPAVSDLGPAPIGLDADGGPVTLDPFDPDGDVPHGLVVGESAARQRVLRAVLAHLATAHPPEELGIVIASMGEDALGGALAFPRHSPHERYAHESLLTRSGGLRRLLNALLEDLRTRAAGAAPTRRTLVVFDLSLTFPASRPEVGEALLEIAQRGRAAGMHLLLASTIVESTTIWARFLPLLRWRVAASPLKPAEMQQVMGRARLDFPPGDTTAYLRVAGGAPRRFEVAIGSAERWNVTADLLRRQREHIDGLDEDERVRTLLRALLDAEAEAAETGHRPFPRHLVFEGPIRPEMTKTASHYGRVLRALKVLTRGQVTVRTLSRLTGEGDLGSAFESAKGGILFIDVDSDSDSDSHQGRAPDALRGFLSLLGTLMRHREDVVVVLCGDHAQLRDAFSEVERGAFRWVRIVEPPAAAPAGGRPAVPGRRVPIGVDERTGDPVPLDFDTDRHLVIAGPAGAGKTLLVHLLVKEIATRVPVQERLIYVLNRGGVPREYLEGAEGDAESRWGVRFPRNTIGFEPLLAEAVEKAGKRERLGHGPEVYVVVTRRQRLLRDDSLRPLLPLLTASPANGLHLVLARQQIMFGDPPDGLLTRLHGLGAAALLVGYSGGQEADLWGVAPHMKGPLAAGQAVLARPDGQRRLRLVEH